MTTSTNTPNPGAVINIKFTEAAMKHAGSAFATSLGASMASLFTAHKQAVDATEAEGTQSAGGGFALNIGNNTTVSVNGVRMEPPSDKQGMSGGFVIAESVTVTQANVNSSVMTGTATVFFERAGTQLVTSPDYHDLTRYQYNTVDASPSSVLGSTSTQVNGALEFLTSYWSDGTSHYISYLTGKLSELSVKASKLLKTAQVKGDLSITVSEVTPLSLQIPPSAPDILPTPAINVATEGSISSINANYYDGSYVKLNTSTPIAVTGETSLLGALANAALWAGDDQVSIILPEEIEQTININTGAGNDTVVAKGGDGELMIDTGSGDDQITLLDDQPSVRTGEGIDTLRADFSPVEMSRYDGLENFVFTGKVAANTEGNALDNQITGGNAGDTIGGGEGNDVLNGLAGNDSLAGGFGDDQVFGGTGNDQLSGGDGSDKLYGGAGNDIYIVDGDEIVSEARSPANSADGGGTDEVRTWIDYTLSTFLEKLTLLGDANLNGAGNGLANTMTGNSGHNVLRGEAGNDLLRGEAGDDRLHGGAGNDALWGGDGDDILNGDGDADTMWGGSGDDIYYINDVRDRVSEALSSTDNSDAGGQDTVYSAISFTLTEHLEHLIMKGESGINATGNAAANIITGNSGDNLINGKGGVDDLNGANGSDIYLIAHPDEHGAAEFGDKGFEGIDEVRFSPTASPAAGSLPGAPKLTLFEGDTGIERVVIGTGTGKLAVTSGKVAADIDASAVKNSLTMIGNNGANKLTGTAFDDILIGSGGMDTLTGGAGKDQFVFSMAPNAKSAVDTFTDFTHGEDQLLFVRSKFANIGPVGNLAESAFSSGAGMTRAQDADDRFLFDTGSGSLYFDRDGTGSGAAVLIGVMSPGTQLSAADFTIVDVI